MAGHILVHSDLLKLDMGNRAPGRVITFYSFKGGTGRSMAVANMGYLLASRQHGAKKTLLIDWDLEAPGLHRYFRHSFGRHLNRPVDSLDYARALDQFPGLLELVADYGPFLDAVSKENDLSDSLNRERARQKFLSRFQEYVLRSDYRGLELLKAGRFDQTYANRLQNFDWRSFHESDPTFFYAFRNLLIAEYDYVLIDSRTGFTDISGICTQAMPDVLVLVFVPNRQNLEGVLDVVPM